LKIIVAVKQVAALDDEFELLEDGRGVDPGFLEYDLNEWDTFSLEAALELRDGADTGEVVVVTVGDRESDEALYGCMARGADRAARIWDPSLADIAADPLAIARILAAFTKGESPDLVLCGVQSSDAANGAVGVALAGYLGMTHVAVVKALAVDAGGSTLTVRRELEGGLVELLRVHLPALLTVQTGINEPRYAYLRAIKQARDKPVAVWTPSELGLEPGEVFAAAGARRLRLTLPERLGSATMLYGSPSDIAARIAELVQKRMSA
jgi:electron transfer flavoprotein beta subunit